MRGCEAVVVELPGYVGGKLDAPAAISVQRHLQACTSCQTELREIERLEQLLAVGLPSISPSPGFASSFANRLAQEVIEEGEESRLTARSFLSWLSQPWLAPVGAAAVVAVIIASIYLPLGSAPPSPWSVRAPGVTSSGGVASIPKQSGPDTKLAQKPSDKIEKKQQMVATNEPPTDVIKRTDLFVNYAVIDDLDQLEPDSNG
jgi:anti-sigma factor RsiW